MIIWIVVHDEQIYSVQHVWYLQIFTMFQYKDVQYKVKKK